MTLRIKQYNEISKEEWDKFVLSNSMGWAYFLYDVIKYHRHVEYKNLSFVIVDEENNNEILLMFMLYRSNKYPILSKLNLKHESLNSQWGYVLKDDISKKKFKELKEVFENYLDNILAYYSFKILNTNLAPLSEFSIKNFNSNLNPLMNLSFTPRIRYTSVVNLSKSDERLLADCEETTRQAIRKLEKSGNYKIIEATNSKEDFDAYVRLHKETYTRTGAEKSIINDEYHLNIFNNLIPQKICRVFFLENENREKIAATAILIYNKNNTAYYWYGCSTNDKEVGINKYLIFKVIEIIRESFGKKGYFETGSYMPYLRWSKAKGLSQFKKCFGTQFVPIYQGEFNNKRRLKRNIAKKYMKEYNYAWK